MREAVAKTIGTGLRAAVLVTMGHSAGKVVSRTLIDGQIRFLELFGSAVDLLTTRSSTISTCTSMRIAAGIHGSTRTLKASWHTCSRIRTCLLGGRDASVRAGLVTLWLGLSGAALLIGVEAGKGGRVDTVLGR